MHSEHLHGDCGCGPKGLHIHCKAKHVIYRTNAFAIGDFVYYNTSNEDYRKAVEGKCDFMVVNVDNCGTWFEVAFYGEFQTRNYDLMGELFIDDTGTLTNTPTATKVGFIENGNLYLFIDRTKVTAPVQTNADWSATSGVSAILNKPSLFSGSYEDLLDTPTIPSAQVNSDWSATSGIAQILNKPTLFDGDYNSLTNKPTTYSLPIASATVLGGVKVGANLTIEADGTLNASAGGGGSSIPMIAGTGEDSLVGNTPLTVGRSLGKASIVLGIDSTTGEDADGAISWGLESSVLSIFAMAGGMNCNVGLNSSGAVSLGMYNKIQDGSQSSFACGQSNTIKEGTYAGFASGQGNNIGINSHFSHVEG